MLLLLFIIIIIFKCKWLKLTRERQKVRPGWLLIFQRSEDVRINFIFGNFPFCKLFAFLSSWNKQNLAEAFWKLFLEKMLKGMFQETAIVVWCIWQLVSVDDYWKVAIFLELASCLSSEFGMNWKHLSSISTPSWYLCFVYSWEELNLINLGIPPKYLKNEKSFFFRWYKGVSIRLGVFSLYFVVAYSFSV